MSEQFVGPFTFHPTAPNVHVGMKVIAPDNTEYRVVAVRIRPMREADADAEIGWDFDPDAFMTEAEVAPLDG